MDVIKINTNINDPAMQHGNASFGGRTLANQNSPYYQTNGGGSPNFMNLDNVDCITKSPIGLMTEDRDNFESPLKNERILRLSESNGSTRQLTSNRILNIDKKRKSNMNPHQATTPFGHNNIPNKPQIVRGQKMPFVKTN